MAACTTANSYSPSANVLMLGANFTSDSTVYPPGSVFVQQHVPGSSEMAEDLKDMLQPGLPVNRLAWLMQSHAVYMSAYSEATQEVYAAAFFAMPNVLVSIKDLQTLTINTKSNPELPLVKLLQTQRDGVEAGLMFVDWSNRLRFRLIGKATLQPIEESSARFDENTMPAGEPLSIRFAISACWGNCPKYIQKRLCVGFFGTDSKTDMPQTKSHLETSDKLKDHHAKVIETSATLLIGSALKSPHPQFKHHVQISHRGGSAGFVRVANPREVWFPDFTGNSMFLSLGNIATPDSVATLVFLDFTTGSILYLHGQADIAVAPADSIEGGTGRSIHFHISSVVEVNHANPFMYKLVELSPYNPIIVDRKSVEACSSSSSSCPPRTRHATLVHVIRHSPTIASFQFELPIKYLQSFTPGQHVIFRLVVDGVSLTRSWTLTNFTKSATSNSKAVLEITVKKIGVASNFLHSMHLGQSLEFVNVEGEFTVPSPAPPKMLFLTAGIGITPSLAQFRGLMSSPTLPNMVLVHSERTSEADVPFLAELNEYQVSNRLRFTLWLTSHKGRLSTEQLLSLVPDVVERHVFLCGPVSFMRTMLMALEQLGVENVSQEDFSY